MRVTWFLNKGEIRDFIEFFLSNTLLLLYRSITRQDNKKKLQKNNYRATFYSEMIEAGRI